MRDSIKISVKFQGGDGELIWRDYAANNKENINEMLKKYCNSNGSTYVVVKATN